MGLQDRDYMKRDKEPLKREIQTQTNYSEKPEKKPFWKMALELTTWIGLIFLTLFLIKNYQK